MDEPVKESNQRELDGGEKFSLDCYKFTKELTRNLQCCVGKTVERIFVGYVPAEHSSRGLFESGWRIGITFKDDDSIYIINPTSIYLRTFGVFFDRKHQMLLDELEEDVKNKKIVQLFGGSEDD